MKKWGKLLAGLMTAVMLVTMPVAASAANDITVYVDDQKLVFDQPPVVQNGRTLVPLRAVSQCMGAEVKWDGATKTININREPEGFYYQNDLYGFTFDTPEGFRFMEEYTDGSGAWYQHKTEPLFLTVMSEYIPYPEGSSIYALQKYLHDEEEAICYSMIRDDYSMEAMFDYGEDIDYYYIHLHNNVGTAVAVNMPWELYETNMDYLDEIHNCLAFG